MLKNCPLLPSLSMLKTQKWMNYSLLSEIKNRIYIITIVDRTTRCILGWVWVWWRTQEVTQLMVDDAPKAR